MHYLCIGKPFGYSCSHYFTKKESILGNYRETEPVPQWSDNRWPCLYVVELVLFSNSPCSVSTYSRLSIGLTSSAWPIIYM